MNISEATAAQTVVAWVTTLTLWEATGDVTDEDLVAAVAVLSRRPYLALGAGDPVEVVMGRIAHVLGSSASPSDRCTGST